MSKFVRLVRRSWREFADSYVSIPDPGVKRGGTRDLGEHVRVWRAALSNYVDSFDREKVKATMTREVSLVVWLGWQRGGGSRHRALTRVACARRTGRKRSAGRRRWPTCARSWALAARSSRASRGEVRLAALLAACVRGGIVETDKARASVAAGEESGSIVKQYTELAKVSLASFAEGYSHGKSTEQEWEKNVDIEASIDAALEEARPVAVAAAETVKEGLTSTFAKSVGGEKGGGGGGGGPGKGEGATETGAAKAGEAPTSAKAQLGKVGQQRSLWTSAPAAERALLLHSRSLCTKGRGEGEGGEGEGEGEGEGTEEEEAEWLEPKRPSDLEGGGRGGSGDDGNFSASPEPLLSGPVPTAGDAAAAPSTTTAADTTTFGVSSVVSALRGAGIRAEDIITVVAGSENAAIEMSPLFAEELVLCNAANVAQMRRALARIRRAGEDSAPPVLKADFLPTSYGNSIQCLRHNMLMVGVFGCLCLCVCVCVCMCVCVCISISIYLYIYSLSTSTSLATSLPVTHPLTPDRSTSSTRTTARTFASTLTTLRTTDR